MKKISIVIPVMRLAKDKNARYFYKKVWGIRETVNSIKNSIKNFDYEFVFIQNGYNDELTTYLKNILLSSPGRLVIISENVGVAKAWNIGMSACDSDLVVISNDDVEFSDLSFDKLMDVINSDPKIAQVGPEGGEWHFDKSGNRKGLTEIEDVDEVSGYFFILRRSAYEDVSGFDEFYTPAGVEEIDFSFKLRNKGYRCLVVPYTGIFHHGYHGVSAKPQTINFLNKSINTHDLDKKNKKYFLDKWYKKS
jgi:GT2 family glycosyltransferase